MDLGDGIGHLTYSTLVHPGDTWDEMWDSLTTYVPQVKARVCPDAPFGVSLRLSNASAQTLVGDQALREQLAGFLADNDLYLYTVNAFPYGPFKNVRVKEQVYEPDWRSRRAHRSTRRTWPTVLAEVGTPDMNPSIQTAPLGFKPNVTGPDVDRLATPSTCSRSRRIWWRSSSAPAGRSRWRSSPSPTASSRRPTRRSRSSASTSTPGRRRGAWRSCPASPSPTPWSRCAATSASCSTSATRRSSTRTSRRRCGKLVDAGHPDPQAPGGGGASRCPEVTDEAVEVLRRYADTVYLTQTMQMLDGELTRFLNLEDAFAAWEADPSPREWRVHFHVPVFLDDLGAFRSTRFAIEDALRVHSEQQLSPQLEIETYTWDVLPDELKTGDIVDYVCREIEWVRGQLVP